MTGWTLYIVPTALLVDKRPDSPHEAQPIPSDSSQSLVRVWWRDTNVEREFEALPGVSHLGFPWEQLPDWAVPLLASFQPDQRLSVATSAALPSTAAPTTPDSVARAMRNIGWR